MTALLAAIFLLGSPARPHDSSHLPKTQKPRTKVDQKIHEATVKERDRKQKGLPPRTRKKMHRRSPPPPPQVVPETGGG